MLDAQERLSTANAAASGPHTAGSGRKGWSLPLQTFLVIIGFITYLPFALMIIISFKTRAQFAVQPIWPTFPLHFENYTFAFKQVLRPVINTTVVCVGTIGVTLFVASLAAYAFARFRFPGKDVLFSITMATLMLPAYVLLIPNFMLFWRLGWLNTYLPLTVPFWFGSAFFIFLFRQFFMTIPIELDEAARIDGASYPRILWSIMLPLSGPVYATAAIIEGIAQWNSFLRPLIILNRPENYPLSVGLRYFVVNPGDQMPKDHLLMAAAIMMTLPVILIFFVGQRYFVRGVVMSGIKG